MASVAESVSAPTTLASALGEGLSTLSSNQTINFQLYVKLILPLDGYIFWVNTNLLTNSALLGKSQFNQIKFDSLGNSKIPSSLIQASGSLHYATDLIQEQSQTASRNNVVFTTQEKIQDFNLISPNHMYIATFDGVRFSFSRSANYYKQANVYHYHGQAIYSIMESQIIDSLTDFDTSDVIVSNSLPLWLSLNNFFTVYPSFLSEQNALLPYATVHIEPSKTEALQSSPWLSIDSSHYQLTKDVVKIDMYGIRNADALEFQDYVNNYSITTDNFGVMNIPIMQDEKIPQKEFGIISMKKTITYEISYYQQNILDIARKLITSAFISLNPE
jgi:hypothetical protein